LGATAFDEKMGQKKNHSKPLFNEIGIRVSHDHVNSALDVKCTLHKKVTRFVTIFY
jgi:hypothetical protein